MSEEIKNPLLFRERRSQRELSTIKLRHASRSLAMSGNLVIDQGTRGLRPFSQVQTALAQEPFPTPTRNSHKVHLADRPGCRPKNVTTYQINLVRKLEVVERECGQNLVSNSARACGVMDRTAANAGREDGTRVSPDPQVERASALALQKKTEGRYQVTLFQNIG